MAIAKKVQAPQKPIVFTGITSLSAERIKSREGVTVADITAFVQQNAGVNINNVGKPSAINGNKDCVIISTIIDLIVKEVSRTRCKQTLGLRLSSAQPQPTIVKNASARVAPISRPHIF